MALKLSRLIEKKCKQLEKISPAQKQHDGLVSSLKHGMKFFRKLIGKDHYQQDREQTFQIRRKDHPYS
jgi:hypothetical protein